MSNVLSKDTIIKTNLITIIGVITCIVGAFVSYTVAINRIGNTERDIRTLDNEVKQIKSDNLEAQKLLIEISTDVRYIKERQ